MKTFEYKTYGKSELAMMYYPNSTKEAAMESFRHELQINPRLRHLISRNRHVYWPKHVRMITAELGEPSEYQHVEEK